MMVDCSALINPVNINSSLEQDLKEQSSALQILYSLLYLKKWNE